MSQRRLRCVVACLVWVPVYLDKDPWVQVTTEGQPVRDATARRRVASLFGVEYGTAIGGGTPARS